jgi:antitoxin (DNA-binding transcriptional repressor) of toxin-antitoxin stability system
MVRKGGWVMSQTVTLEEARARLEELIEKLPVGEEVVIVKEHKPIAKLVGQRAPARQRPGPGLCKGMITIVADDDAHLAEFSEYLP